MYKLVIVDDELSARAGLKDCFDWSEFEIEVAGEADNGIKALEVIQKVKPDIVITDVKMPKMDGIKLSAELSRLYKNIKIIFISGYDEFEYLKSALKIEAVDYILKPVNLKEMRSVIKKVGLMLEGNERQKRTIYQMHTRLMQSMPLLREKFLMSIVREGLSEGNKLQEKLDFLDLKLKLEGKYIVLIISIDDYASLFDGVSAKERELTSFSVLNICQELIESQFSGYSYENRPGEYICLLELKTDEEKLFAFITEIQSKLEKFLNIKVTIGIGSEVDSLGNLPQSYKMAYEAVSQKLFLGKNHVIAIDSIGTYQPVIPVLDMEKWNKLVLATKTADKESVLLLIDSLFEELAASRSININYCHNVCLQLLIIASGLLMDMEIIHDDELTDVKSKWDYVFKLETIEDMREFAKSYYRGACGLISEKRNKRSTNVVEKVKDIINKKYNTNLTINSIAKEVYIASTYLCLVFRQETGETLNEYLTGVRINKAKELLMDPGIKLYDVCFAVGYTDASYFTKIFKKSTGLTPSDFRRKYL